MPKGLSISETDLQAKGYHVDSAGNYAWDKFTPPIKIEVLKKIPEARPVGLVAIENVLKAARIHFENEVQVHPDRNWRFDIAVPSLKVAVEYEGIFSKKSRHTGVNGYTEDSNKYNAAQLLGWKVLRYTAKNYKNFINDIKQLMK